MTDKEFNRLQAAAIISAALEYDMAILYSKMIGIDKSKTIKSASLFNEIFAKEPGFNHVNPYEFVKTDDHYANQACHCMSSYQFIVGTMPELKSNVDAFSKWSHHVNHFQLFHFGHWITNIAIAWHLVYQGKIQRDEFEQWIERSTKGASILRLNKRSAARAFFRMMNKMDEINNKIKLRKSLKTA